MLSTIVKTSDVVKRDHHLPKAKDEKHEAPEVVVIVTDQNNNNQQQLKRPGGNGGAIKRGCDDVEGETEDDLVTLSSSSIGYSRRSPPKKPKFVVTSQEMNVFFSLLNIDQIQRFLNRDVCCLISDKVF